MYWKKLRVIATITFAFLFCNVTLQAQKISKTVFQAFWWDYKNNNYPNGWANYLTELAPRLKSAGFDAIWIPPIYKNPGDWVGYFPFDHYDLGDKYQKGFLGTRLGTKDEVLRMIAVMHANGIEVINDIVLNHTGGAGSSNGSGGIDSNFYSLQSAEGYKNFRYVSYSTPAIDESKNDYWTRTGRWSKNYHNFYPNPNNNCNSGDICGAMFGAAENSFEFNAVGQSSNIPTSGNAVIGNITRPYYNPPQNNNYMRDNARNWLLWFQKQTGGDGLRWDAVKHFPVDVQEDLIYNTKYLNDWASTGENMFCVGEWIGNINAMDTYVNTVKTGQAPGVANEKHTGTFDFSFRGYGPNGGIYSMVLSQGSYNMQNIPSEQQNERYMDYPGGKRVYRTVPFVNSHDTFRPRLNLSPNGNYPYPLGDNAGWIPDNEQYGELGGNGAHIDPREPRLAAAYAITTSVDGNPKFFFEDFFDIGTTGKRWTHFPTNTTDLPLRGDIQNILHAHQKLGFKQGDYAVPTSLSGNNAPFYQRGTSGDHLVIERIGKAVIGITDKYSNVENNSNDEEVWITIADTAWIGKFLYDYSGAHGITTTQVQGDRRVLIKTAPVGHTISGAYGHGYSIWAPAPSGITISSVQDLYNYVATYQPTRSPITTQEWEMANDLGDSHPLSLQQGGQLPATGIRFETRTVGKIYAESGRNIHLELYPTNEKLAESIMLQLTDASGTKISVTGKNTIMLDHIPSQTGYCTIKIANQQVNSKGQRVYVKATYTAPAVVNTAMFPKNGELTENAALPQSVELYSSYPNPFNPNATIKFALPSAMKAKLVVYNVLGQEVATLVDATLEAGEHAYDFDGSRLATGVYIYKLVTPNATKTGKMILNK